MSTLRASLRIRLTSAMRSGDKAAVGALRNVISALDNEEAVPALDETGRMTSSPHVAGSAVGVGAAERPRRILSTEDELRVIAHEAAELRASAETLAAAGHRARADELLRAAAVVEEAAHG